MSQDQQGYISFLIKDKRETEIMQAVFREEDGVIFLLHLSAQRPQRTDLTAGGLVACRSLLKACKYHKIFFFFSNKQINTHVFLWSILAYLLHSSINTLSLSLSSHLPSGSLSGTGLWYGQRALMSPSLVAPSLLICTFLKKKYTGKQWKQWLTLYFCAPKSLQMVIAAMKLKDAYSLEGKLWPT